MRKSSLPKLLAATLGVGTLLIGLWQLLKRRPAPKADAVTATAAKAAPLAPRESNTSAQPRAGLGADSPASIPSLTHSTALAGWLDRVRGGWRSQIRSLDAVLFGLSLAVFAMTRLVGLENFPIYFFTDEAIQTVLAAGFVKNGFRDHLGALFPTFFQNYSSYNLSASVYLQVIPYLLFGQSLVVTRAVSVLVAFTGMIAVGLILKNIFHIRFWWIGVLLLSITPAWFLHSRTAFETVIATAIYAWCLYFYLRYRQGHPRSLLAALAFGALAFYTYSAIQLVIVLTSLALLLIDAGYHWQNRRIAAQGLLLTILLALPYVRFQNEHPDETFLHARRLDSYLMKSDLSVGEKFNRFFDEYTYGLSPAFWYQPDNTRDLIRHKMKGYGNILPVTLPFALLGVLVCLRRIRSPEHRTLLIAAALAPTGAAFVEVYVTRAMAFVVPAALLTAIGLAALSERLVQRVDYSQLAIGLGAGLIIANVAMLNDALVNSPTWYNDYHLGGLQYGAKEVFAAIRDYLRRSPDTRILLSPTWANGTDTLQRFFLPDEPRVALRSISTFTFKKVDLSDGILLIMTPYEYQEALANPKFTDIRVEQTLPYPNGENGFYFVRLRYSPQADAIFAAELEARRQLVREEFTLNGQPVSIAHTQFDIGRLRDLFDNDTFTLARTIEINPFVIEITFPQPRPLSGLTATTTKLDFTLTARIFTDENAEPVEYSQTYRGLPSDPTVQLDFPAPLLLVSKIRIEIRDINAGDEAFVHVRELTLR